MSTEEQESTVCQSAARTGPDQNDPEFEKRLKEALRETNAYLCYSCGKCTYACPLTSPDSIYSPRQIVENIVIKGKEGVEADKFFNCLTCGLCLEYCRGGVDFHKFVYRVREILYSSGTYEKEAMDKCSHAGILHSIMKILAKDGGRQNRLYWLDTSDIKTSDESDILLFTGCAPYFNIYFEQWGDHNRGNVSAIKLLNRMGVKPRLLKDEVCCGHDLLWTGDRKNFERLAAKNIKLLEENGIKTVLFTCPECYHTFQEIYAKDYSLPSDIKLQHMTEYLLENIDKLDFSEHNGKEYNENEYNENEQNEKAQNEENGEKGSEARKVDKSAIKSAVKEMVSLQDSCRMGRLMGKEVIPRELLSMIPGVELRELDKSGKRAVCCGTSCWMSCGSSAKRVQVERLREASEKSGLLLTICPKCLVHFKCALDGKQMEGDEPLEIEVKDLITYIAESIGL